MSTNWDDLKAPPSGGTSNRDIERVKYTDSTKIRLIGSVVPRYLRWIATTDGRRLPIECLSFDRDTQQLTSRAGTDPVLELPQEIQDKIKPQFAYASNAIDRSDGKLKIIDLKPTVYKQILSLARNPEYGNPADPKTGYDLNITREKTGPQAINVRYNVVPSRSSTPLSADELQLELYELEAIFKRPDYASQKQFLMEQTSYYEGEVPDDLSTPQEEMQDI